MEPNESSSWNNLRRSIFEANEFEEMSSEEGDDTEIEESEEIGSNGEDKNLRILTPDELKCLKFANPEAAYHLYNEFGLSNGFSVRKNNTGRVKSGDKVCNLSFVCSREGRHDRKRDNGPIAKCGCDAKMHIRFDRDSGLWYVAYLNDNHNHPLIDKAKLNLVVKKLEDDDAKSAIKYLHNLAFTDPYIYWRCKVDGKGLLRHLFWSDGTCQVDYKTFGDVLAIDATYKMNKHNYRLVVFSGSNHHNKICVFGSAIVSDLSEKTYVWLLQQFLKMKGNYPQLVITNGDSSVRSAINSVFPQAHHRLCSWSLSRNATAKVRKTRFTALFKECMTDNCEIKEWEDKWKAMVKECGVKHIKWVQDMYEVKNMWATAYMRGNFFQGYRTSSRCEGLLKQVNKTNDQSRSFLAELLKSFQHCLEHMRWCEVGDDFKCFNGEPVMQTVLEPLEKSGASVYTRDIFFKYRSVLFDSACMILMLNPKKTASSTIYTVIEYLKPTSNWTVSFYPEDMEFRCSCFHMESFGIPCVHIIIVVINLNISLPKSLVLNRWTKNAKEGVEPTLAHGSNNDFNGNKRKRVACGSSQQLPKNHGEQIGTSTVGGTDVARRSKRCVE